MYVCVCKLYVYMYVFLHSLSLRIYSKRDANIQMYRPKLVEKIIKICFQRTISIEKKSKLQNSPCLPPITESQTFEHFIRIIYQYDVTKDMLKFLIIYIYSKFSHLKHDGDIQVCLWSVK